MHSAGIRSGESYTFALPAQPVSCDFAALQDALTGPRTFAKFKHQINELTEEIKARGPPQAEDVSIAAHLQRLQENGEPLPDDLLAAEVGVYFAAGIESAGNAMSWTL